MKSNYILGIVFGVIVLILLVLILLPKQETIDLNYSLKISDYNDRITLNYELTVDGSVLESSFNSDSPLIFVIGSGSMIPGFEKGALGLTEGQEKVIQIQPKDAYGTLNDYPQKQEMDLTFVLTTLKNQTGKEYTAKEIQKEKFSLSGRNCMFDGYDLNKNTQTIACQHPLAGKTLTFKIKIIKIEKPNEYLNQNSDLNSDLNKDN